MKSEQQFINEQADKAFQVIAGVFASGGEKRNGLMQIKEILYAVSTYSKKCLRSDILQKFQDFCKRIERV